MDLGETTGRLQDIEEQDSATELSEAEKRLQTHIRQEYMLFVDTELYKGMIGAIENDMEPIINKLVHASDPGVIKACQIQLQGMQWVQTYFSSIGEGIMEFPGTPSDTIDQAIHDEMMGQTVPID